MKLKLCRRDGEPIELDIEHDRLKNAAVIKHDGRFYTFGSLEGQFYTVARFNQCDAPIEVGEPHIGDGSGDAAIAIGEHAHRAGYEAALLYAKDEGWAYYPDELERAVLAGNAWNAYVPPEHIKALS